MLARYQRGSGGMMAVGDVSGGKFGKNLTLYETDEIKVIKHTIGDLPCYFISVFIENIEVRVPSDDNRIMIFQPEKGETP